MTAAEAIQDTLRVTVEDGKYTVLQTSDGKLTAFRYGEAWRDLTGDKLVLALAVAVYDLQARIAAMRGDE